MELLLRRLSSRLQKDSFEKTDKNKFPRQDNSFAPSSVDEATVAVGDSYGSPRDPAPRFVNLLQLILLILVLHNLFLPALTTLQPFPRAAPDTTGETGLTNSSRQ